MNKEIWKPIPSFPGYEASSQGRIRTYLLRGKLYKIMPTPQHILKASLNKSRPHIPRYYKVTLTRNGKNFQRMVAHLVLETFVGPRPEGKQVCHNDCNSLNNCVTNLRYDTRRNNFTDGVGLHAEKWLTNAQVQTLREDATNGITDEELAQRYGISIQSVCNCRTKLTYTHVGGPRTTRYKTSLTDNQVARMREENVQNSPSLAELAGKYNVSTSCVSYILRGLRRQSAGGPITANRYLSP